MMENALTNIMGSMGRQSDSMIGHLTNGDVVIPRDIALEHPEFLTKFQKIMQDKGSDYRTHIAGSGYENKNPHTGASEFFFNGLKNFFSNPVKQITQAVNDPMGTFYNSAKTGSLFGGQILDAVGLGPQKQNNQSTIPAADLGSVSQEFTPKRPDAAVQPFGLFSSSVGGQQFSTLDPTQQRSYLATQGAQGGGIGDEAKNYYLNLLQRNLIDENGQQQNINTALLPIERNYLSRLGLPTDNTTDFFKALQT